MNTSKRITTREEEREGFDKHFEDERNYSKGKREDFDVL